MTLAEFTAALSAAEPPPLSPELAALWFDARGEWDAAHDLAQSQEGASGGAGDWVHAYLHRKEGDQGNAAYWYAKARRPFPRSSLDEEWAEIVATLLQETA